MNYNRATFHHRNPCRLGQRCRRRRRRWRRKDSRTIQKVTDYRGSEPSFLINRSENFAPPRRARRRRCIKLSGFAINSRVSDIVARSTCVAVEMQVRRQRLIKSLISIKLGRGGLLKIEKTLLQDDQQYSCLNPCNVS